MTPEEQVVELEMINQKLREGLTWALGQLKEVDHDCKAGPDSGCSWCFPVTIWYCNG